MAPPTPARKRLSVSQRRAMNIIRRFKLGTLRSLRQIDRRQRAVGDAVVIVVLAGIAYYFTNSLDLFNAIVKYQAVYGDWGLDDLVLICVVLSFALTAFGWRRFQDLTKEMQERRKAEEQVRENVREIVRAKTFLNTIVDNVPTMIFVRELPERRFVLINREAEKMLGLPREKLLGKSPAELFPAPAARTIEKHDNAMLQAREGVAFDEEVPLPTRQLGTRVTVATGLAIRDDQGTPRYLVNVVQDITERKRAEAQIAHLAQHDPLTDLPNRTAFNAYIETVVDQAKTTNEGFAVMCIDLDRFKEVNDVFGHATGDALLLRGGEAAACGMPMERSSRGSAATSSSLILTMARNRRPRKLWPNARCTRFADDIDVDGPGARASASASASRCSRSTAPRRRVAAWPMPTPRCIAPRRKAAVRSASSTPRWMSGCASGVRSSTICDSPSRRRVRSALPAASRDRRRRHRLRSAGALESLRPAAWFRPASSFRWRKKAA